MNEIRPYVMRCPSCRKRNRIPAEKMGLTAKCGNCGERLATDGLLSGNPIMVTDGNFDDTVGKSPLPVLLFCWAPWCPTCGTVAPSTTTETSYSSAVRLPLVFSSRAPIISAAVATTRS